uniref:Uncharacterized protein n=2 Tax=Quercus lobata TaxID=97700 RepID=A0A7N2M144_QUELO
MRMMRRALDMWRPVKRQVSIVLCWAFCVISVLLFLLLLSKQSQIELRPAIPKHKPRRSRMGDDCCEPLPQSVGAKKGLGLGLGLRLSLSKPRRSQSESDDFSEPLSQSQVRWCEEGAGAGAGAEVAFLEVEEEPK